LKRLEFELEVGYQLKEAKGRLHSEQDERPIVIGVASLLTKGFRIQKAPLIRERFYFNSRTVIALWHVLCKPPVNGRLSCTFVTADF
jgi:hypothetical protein